MTIFLYILAYLLVGFVATVSPAGQYAWHRLDLPPIVLLLLWPLFLPIIIVVAAGFAVNDWLEEIIR
jgi:hypothetical protein